MEGGRERGEGGEGGRVDEGNERGRDGTRNFCLHFDSGHYHKPPQPRSAHFARCARDRSLILRRYLKL